MESENKLHDKGDFSQYIKEMGDIPDDDIDISSVGKKNKNKISDIQTSNGIGKGSILSREDEYQRKRFNTYDISPERSDPFNEKDKYGRTASDVLKEVNEEKEKKSLVGEICGNKY